MAKDTRQKFLAELAKVEPTLARAFEEAIQDIRSTAQIAAIDAAIQRGVQTGDVTRAVQEVTAAINLGREFFAPLDQAMVQAYIQGGAYQVGLLPKRPTGSAPRLVARFDTRNPRAEAASRQMATALITEINVDTDRLIRETITEAIENNQQYRSITRSLVGRLDGNQRKGGLIGLHSSQAEAVRKARQELLAGDYSAYLRRSPNMRNRSFELQGRALWRAMNRDEPLSLTEVDKITGAYADNLLKLRARTIARTEANRVMQAGRSEAVEQLIESDKIPVSAITKIWDAVSGPRTRESHMALNGQEQGWNDVFVSPVTGAVLRYPHDANAPGDETINCRCTMRTRIDYASLAE